MTAERAMTGLCVTVVLAMVVTVGVTLYNETEYTPAARETQTRPALSPDSTGRASSVAPIPTAPPRSPGEALNEGRINHMIGILRSAAVRGDDTTKRAMIVGISNHGRAVRSPLLRALERETDPKASAAIHEALDSLGDR